MGQKNLKASAYKFETDLMSLENIGNIVNMHENNNNKSRCPYKIKI